MESLYRKQSFTFSKNLASMLNIFQFQLFLNEFDFRSTLSVLSDQLQDKKNETALDDWYNRKIGRVKANRISQELMEDAKSKAMSLNFEQTRVLLEGYHRCKDQGSIKMLFFQFLLICLCKYITTRNICLALTQKTAVLCVLTNIENCDRF
jgi:hypothetical protein